MLDFPKRQRLLRRPEFSKTMDDGTKVVGTHLVLIGRRNGEALSKIGFIVSKKVGNAVVRNLVKRRLREIYRNYLLKPQGLDIVVIARGQAARTDFDDLTSSFHEGLNKLRARLQRTTPDGTELPASGPIRSRHS